LFYSHTRAVSTILHQIGNSRHTEPVGRVISQKISALAHYNQEAPATPMVPLRPVKNCSARGHVDAVLTESTFLSHRLVHHRHSQQTVEPLLESLNAQSLQPPHRQPQNCSARSPHRSSSTRSRPQAYRSEFAQRTVRC
jgi:hypothetical protein